VTLLLKQIILAKVTRPTFCSYPCSTWRYLHTTSESHTTDNRIRSKLFRPLDVT